MIKKYAHRKGKRVFRVVVEPCGKASVPDVKLMAFITEKARESRYNPDEDPVLKDFRKRMGWAKTSSF